MTTPAFTFTRDHLGRTIALTTDTQAVALLARASRSGWTEIPDVAYGYSQSYAPGTPVHTLCLQLYRAGQAAHAGRTDYLYAADAWDITANRSRTTFAEDRAQDRVLSMVPSFGYTPDPATTPVRFQG